MCTLFKYVTSLLVLDQPTHSASHPFCPTCFASNPSLPTLVAMQPTNLTPSRSRLYSPPRHTTRIACSIQHMSCVAPHKSWSVQCCTSHFLLASPLFLCSTLLAPDRQTTTNAVPSLTCGRVSVLPIPFTFATRRRLTSTIRYCPATHPQPCTSTPPSTLFKP